MDIVVPAFENAIEFLLDAVMQIYTALYTLFNSDAIWSLLGIEVEITIPNIFGGEDIVGSWSILIMLFSYGLTSFIIFSLWKWVRSGI